MLQPKLNKRNCKFCGEKFQKKRPLDAFCKIMCQIAYQKEKDYAKVSFPAKKSKVKPIPKFKLIPIGEATVFEEIWAESDKTSFVTGKLLSDPINARVWYFSHVLPKGKAKYPMFKYYKKNIVLKEFIEHETWEYKQSSIIDDPLWKHVFELKEKLIEEYAEHLKLFEKGLVEYYKI